jgi:general secretion pathway protein G
MIQSRPLRRAARRAFTLLEIIVVVTIIAMLATLVAPRVIKYIGKSKANVAKAEASNIAKTLGLYLVDQGDSKVPNGFELHTLLEGNDPYLSKEDDLIDPWGNAYVLVVPPVVNKDFDIVSYGADGKPGGEGDDADITN